jgi:hypothetical protein
VSRKIMIDVCMCIERDQWVSGNKCKFTCFLSQARTSLCIQCVGSDRQVREAQKLADSAEMQVKAFQFPETLQVK